MKARGLRQQMKSRRRALRLQMAGLKARLREQLARNPVLAQRAHRRRRRRFTFLMVILVGLLLALLQRCSCGPPSSPSPGVAIALDAGTALGPPAPLAPLPKLTAPRLRPQHRADYQVPALAPPPWLDEFRLQVAARSPKLAECFRGAPRPGALRWTTAISPGNGLPSDHELEPVGETLGLRPDQRECLIRALSAPAYRLSIPAGAQTSSTPSRVSIVLEF